MEHGLRGVASQTENSSTLSEYPGETRYDFAGISYSNTLKEVDKSGAMLAILDRNWSVENV